MNFHHILKFQINCNPSWFCYCYSLNFFVFSLKLVPIQASGCLYCTRKKTQIPDTHFYTSWIQTTHFNALRKSKTLVVVFVSVCIWVVWYMSVFLYTWTMTLYVSLVTPPISRWIWESLRVKVTYSLSMQRKTQSIHSTTILQDLFWFSIWISVGQVICSEIENILFLC